MFSVRLLRSGYVSFVTVRRFFRLFSAPSYVKIVSNSYCQVDSVDMTVAEFDSYLHTQAGFTGNNYTDVDATD